MAGSEQAQQLAERFNQLNGQVIALVEPLSEEQWSMACGDDKRPIGVVAHHVGTAYGNIAAWVRTMADGQPLPPVTPAIIDEWNAQHAEANADVSKAETLDLLKSNGDKAVAAVAGLSDEELAQSGAVTLLGGATVTAAQLIEYVLFGHTGGHLTGMRAALGR
ncbi:MAG: DinB family protein [Anaerolineae bacterium]